jgi:hypothetical protein
LSATLHWWPTLSGVRKTERFQDGVRNAGMVDYWGARPRLAGFLPSDDDNKLRGWRAEEENGDRRCRASLLFQCISGMAVIGELRTKFVAETQV